jgi:hypothetical protein
VEHSDFIVVVAMFLYQNIKWELYLWKGDTKQVIRGIARKGYQPPPKGCLQVNSPNISRVPPNCIVLSFPKLSEEWQIMQTLCIRKHSEMSWESESEELDPPCQSRGCHACWARERLWGWGIVHVTSFSTRSYRENTLGPYLKQLERL